MLWFKLNFLSPNQEIFLLEERRKILVSCQSILVLAMPWSTRQHQKSSLMIPWLCFLLWCLYSSCLWWLNTALHPWLLQSNPLHCIWGARFDDSSSYCKSRFIARNQYWALQRADAPPPPRSQCFSHHVGEKSVSRTLRGGHTMMCEGDWWWGVPNVAFRYPSIFPYVVSKISWYFKFF